MLRYTQRILWRLTAVVALACGLVGLALPIVPTVPFLILAAWAASKSSPRLEQWLLANPHFGGHIRAWREGQVVPRKAKVFAVITMSVSAIGLQFTSAQLWLRIAVPVTMTLIAIWLCTRPEQQPRE